MRICRFFLILINFTEEIKIYQANGAVKVYLVIILKTISVKSFYYITHNKLIFLYLKTRHCKFYALNIMYIKLYKSSWIRN